MSMWSPILKGITLGLLLSMSVGPVIFAILKQSMNNGHRGGFAFVAGISASDLTVVVLCNYFTTLFKRIMAHEEMIAIGGSIFLIGMGLYNIFLRKNNYTDTSNRVDISLRKRDLAGIFFTGYFMNLLNPGSFLFWFAATASLIGDSKTFEDPVVYRQAVFISCLSIVLCTDILKVLLSNLIRDKLTPRNIHHINVLSGIVLIIFGIVILTRFML